MWVENDLSKETLPVHLYECMSLNGRTAHTRQNLIICIYFMLYKGNASETVTNRKRKLING